MPGDVTNIETHDVPTSREELICEAAVGAALHSAYSRPNDRIIVLVDDGEGRGASVSYGYEEDPRVLVDMLLKYMNAIVTANGGTVAVQVTEGQ